MFLAYRWARKKYQERQQERNEAPSAPPTNSVDLPLRTKSASGAGGIAASDVSRSLEGPSTTPLDGDHPATTEKASSKPKKPELTPKEKAQERRRRVYRWKVVLGLFAPFTLQSLDTTIIASALPFIAKDFSESLNIMLHSFPRPRLPLVVLSEPVSVQFTPD